MFDVNCQSELENQLYYLRKMFEKKQAFLYKVSWPVRSGVIDAVFKEENDVVRFSSW